MKEGACVGNASGGKIAFIIGNGFPLFACMRNNISGFSVTTSPTSLCLWESRSPFGNSQGPIEVRTFWWSERGNFFLHPLAASQETEEKFFTSGRESSWLREKREMEGGAETRRGR